MRSEHNYSLFSFFLFLLLIFCLIAIAVDSSGICGALRISDPLDACSSLRNGLRPNETDKTRFALIVRGECAFKDKVQNAQNAGFRGAIVYDDRDKGKLVYSESPCPFKYL